MSVTAAKPTVRKYDMVFYNARSSIIRARVKTIHRDGSVSVVALFPVNPDGTDMAGYLGFTYRLPIEKCRLAA